MPEDKPNEEGRLISPAAPDDQPPERTGRSWPWVVIVLVVVLGIGLLVYLRLRTPPVIPHPPAPVEIAMTKVEKGAIPVYVNWALGTVTPLATVTVLSRVDGQIMKVNYTEGQIVPAGFVLLQIDSRPFDAQLATAQGQLQHDREVLAETKINQKRYEEAYAQKAIPKQQLDDQASLVRQLEGTVKLDEGQVAAAQTQVDYCTISAPVAGLVGLRLVDVGNIVHAAGTTGLVVVAQLQPITVIFSVAEDSLPAIQEQLRAGHVLPVEAWSRDQKNKLAMGTLLALDSQIDTATGTIRLRAQFDNKDDALFPNQFVNARLLLNTLSDVMLVPTGAIQRSAQGAFVYVVKSDNTLEMRPVKVGITEGDLASVTGVTADETIAGDNFNRLQEGMAVTQRKEASAATPATTNAAETPKGQKP
ncbi:MAG: efflux RND transporter periplasmic adaptor subunit [Candidatus Brocadiia bacterium]